MAATLFLRRNDRIVTRSQEGKFHTFFALHNARANAGKLPEFCLSLLKNWAFPAKILSENCSKILAALQHGVHIVAARHCELRSAMPPPFLGVSSLNLAAPSGAAFFSILPQVGAAATSTSKPIAVGGDQFRERLAEAAANTLEMRAGFDPLLVQIEHAIDLDLQRMNAGGRPAVKLGRVAAGIGRVARDAETRRARTRLRPDARAMAPQLRHSGRRSRCPALQPQTASNGNR